MMLADKTADIQLKTREKSINTKRNYDSNARFKQTFELGIMFAPFVGRPVTVVCTPCVSHYWTIGSKHLSQTAMLEESSKIFLVFREVFVSFENELILSSQKTYMHGSIGLRAGQCQIGSFAPL